MWVEQCHVCHPWLGMVNIPPIKMVMTGGWWFMALLNHIFSDGQALRTQKKPPNAKTVVLKTYLELVLRTFPNIRGFTKSLVDNHHNLDLWCIYDNLLELKKQLINGGYPKSLMAYHEKSEKTWMISDIYIYTNHMCICKYMIICVYAYVM